MSRSFDHLHLGCGLTTPRGWLNVDGSYQVVLARHAWLKRGLTTLGVMPQRQAEIPWSSDVMRLNLRAPLPWQSQTFVAVYSSHTLEHLYQEEALALLKESRRVLKVGGACRAVVPDLESIVVRYTVAKRAGDPDAATRFMEEMMVHDKRRQPGPLGIYYRLTGYHQHKWMYDAASIKLLFETAGFTDVRQMRCHESRIARIAEVEDAKRIVDGQGVAIEGVMG